METPNTSHEPLEGRKFRFTINSAEEAVKMIREHLGEKARVLSVNQIGGKGFSRFLSSPKLEVIAMVPPEEKMAETPQTQQTKTEHQKNEQPAKEPTPPKPEIKISETFSKQPISTVLRRAGFGESLLLQIENTPRWKELSELNIPHAITEFARWLSQEYQRIQIPQLSSRIAFIGTPGSGKTMSLCKILAEKVFLHNKPAKVLKLEANTPNPDDVLSIFCETLGVELLRDPAEMETNAQDVTTYIDLPGIVATDEKGWSDLEKQLSALNIQTRILVVNAAYDSNLVKNILEQGLKAKATHLILTHVDELINTTHLWNFTLQSRIPTLYLSYGQNITGDISSNTLEYLNEQTFSSILGSVEK